MSKHTFFIAFLILVFSGCELETERYSFIPQIEFKELIVKDSLDLLGNPSRLITLHFYLIDGNGDIGPIYNPDYIGNCNLELYYLKDGIYQQDTAILDTLRWPTIPYVGDLGQDKTLKADIFIDYAYNTFPTNSYTSFFYTVFVYDMSLNKSNIINTDTIFME